MVHVPTYGRRLNWGGIFLTGVAANFATVSLYNDSTIGHVLRVRGYTTAAAGTTTGILSSLRQGTVGTINHAGIASFAGEQQHAGSIYNLQTTTAPSFVEYVATPGSTAYIFPTWPLWYIRPNWSLSFETDNSGIAMYATWWWEDIDMSMLEECELE